MWVHDVLQWNAKLIEVVTRQQDDQKQEEGLGKRKNMEDISYQPQEPVLLLEESYRIEDDGHGKVDTLL